MKNISIDIETFSDVDLSKCGAYKYAESPNFEILLFGYAADNGDVQVIDLANGDKIPDEILIALTDKSVLKWAFNANFERVCLSAYLKKYYSQYNFNGDYLDPSSWRCTMIWSAYLGLPLSLKGVGAVLKLDEQKMDEGKDLIKYFCVPCKPTKANGERTRNYPYHAPDKWLLFKKYNKRDVEVEMAVQKKLSRFPVSDFVWNEYHLDQKINDRGIAVDMDMVKSAIDLDEITRNRLQSAMRRITNLENPNSVQQMKQWLCENGVEVDSLGKKDVAELLKTSPPELAEVLVLRQQLSKSSVKKYQAMQNSACKDNRARGMFQFYGANRSGRWAGRIIQLQNLPQNHIEDLEQARSLVKSGNFEALNMLYENIPDTLSQLIRTAFVPRKGMKFIVADFSAIEARVIAWLAKSRMFGVPVVKHGENGHLRQKGKIAELACGYGGSVGAMKSMGGSELGLSDSELKQIVDDWRSASPNIVKLWWDVDKAVKDCIKMKTETETHGLEFTYESGFLFIKLPSGRRLAYVKPRIGVNKFGGESVTYEGIDSNKKWKRLESYGPKFVENIVQAIARDLLMNSMQRLKNYSIVAHVHDEIIIECDKKTPLESICEIMGRTPGWASGLLLRADGYECDFYKKD